MQKLSKVSFLLLLSIFIVSCSSKDNKKILLTNITGELNEVLLVMDNGALNSESNKLIKSILHTDVPGLPQDEAMFDVVDIERKGFISLFQLYRNILDVNISNKYKKNKIWFGRDVYAKTQVYIKIEAMDYKGLNELINRNSGKILQIFRDAELARLQKSYKNRFSVDVVKHIKKKFGVKIDIPANYKLDMDSNRFSWISFETPYLSQGILIYSFPYSDTTQFSQAALLHMTDSVCKRYVKGPSEGSYMTTEYDFPISYSTKLDSNQFYAVSIRNLWETKGDFMGGPAFSYYFPDKKRENIIGVTNYVYCPKKDKRNYMMQLEAIVKTAAYLKKAKK